MRNRNSAKRIRSAIRGETEQGEAGLDGDDDGAAAGRGRGKVRDEAERG
jgi:hypothetical protein